MDDSPDVVLQRPDVDLRCRGILNSSFPWIVSDEETVDDLVAAVNKAFDQAASNGGFSVRAMREALCKALWPVVVSPCLEKQARCFIGRLCANEHDAEQVYQDACVKITTSLLTWHTEGKDWDFKAWFNRCCANEVKDHWRRVLGRRRRPPRESLSDGVRRVPEAEVMDHRERDPAVGAGINDLVWRVRDALADPMLTPEQRCLGGLFLSEATTSEIADALNIEGKSRLSNVHNKLQRLFTKLRQLIEIE